MNSTSALHALDALLQDVAPLSPAALAKFHARCTVRTYEPGHCFNEIGTPTTEVAIVLTGLFRIFYVTPSGDEVIRRFATAGRLVGSLSAITAHATSEVTTEALEPATVAAIQFSELETLFDADPAWQRLGRLMMQRYYILLERREHQFLVYPATERYQLFRQEHPGLEQRLTQAHIASYLGISPVSLSRIRSTRRKHQDEP